MIQAEQMKSKGYIKLHRTIFSHWVWKDKPFSKGQAWVDLVMMANYKANKFVLGNEIVEVERGQFITSELKLMERWGWGKSKTRGFLKVLEDDGMIIKKSDRQKTTINIINYPLYQDSETTDEPQTDHEQTTNEPQTDHKPDTNKKDKKDKKDTIHENELESIVDKFNSTCITLPGIKKLTDKRKAILRKWVKEDGIETIYEVFEKVKESDFLSGRIENSERPWKANFDWIINPTNRLKILEGNYVNKKQADSINDEYYLIEG